MLNILLGLYELFMQSRENTSLSAYILKLTNLSNSYLTAERFFGRVPVLAKDTLINRAGGLYGRILTKVVSTDRMQQGLYTRTTYEVKILP